MEKVTSYKLQVTRKPLMVLRSYGPTVFFLLCLLPLNAQQIDTTTLNLLNPTYPTVFNYTSNGYWTQTFNDEDFTFFKSQIFSFSHLIEGPGSAYNGMAWNGFTVCNSGDDTDYSYTGNWFNFQWGCMAGGGIMTDAQGNILKDENGYVKVQKEIPYLVGYWNYIIEPEWWHLGWGNTFIDEPTRCFQILLDDDKKYEAVGVYVNTHPYSYYAVSHGFGLASQLNQQGDYFKLIFHGINKDGTENGKFVEHFLAKYENNQLIQSTKWEWVDLSSLGEIGGIYCTMASTDVDEYGPLTPLMFCMDKLQVRTKSTGIVENKNFSKIKIYSFQNSVFIKNESNNEYLSVKIFDMYGRLVYQGAIHNKETKITLPVVPGIYNVVLYGKDAARDVSTKVLITNH